MDGSNYSSVPEPAPQLALPDFGQSVPLDFVFGLGRPDGILYVEDFDAPPAPEADPAPDLPEDPPEPVFSAADVAAAHAAGRRAGQKAALTDAMLMHIQLQTAALQALSDALAASRVELECVAARHAEQAARTALSLLHAAIPATMAAHGKTEITAMLEALLPGLRCEPALRVRTHPSLADFVRESLIARLGPDGGVLAVVPTETMARGDIAISWENGKAWRDCAAIHADITAALAPLELPPLEELRGGQ